jgi:hypothetical protein
MVFQRQKLELLAELEAGKAGLTLSSEEVTAVVQGRCESSGDGQGSCDSLKAGEPLREVTTQSLWSTRAQLDCA